MPRLVYVLAVPWSKKDSVEVIWKNLYWHEQLKIKTTSPAVDNQANKAIHKLLAKYYDVPQSSITLKHWWTNREKVFIIS